MAPFNALAKNTNHFAFAKPRIKNVIPPMKPEIMLMSFFPVYLITTAATMAAMKPTKLLMQMKQFFSKDEKLNFAVSASIVGDEYDRVSPIEKPPNKRIMPQTIGILIWGIFIM